MYGSDKFKAPRFYDQESAKNVIVNALGDMLIDEQPFELENLLITITELRSDEGSLILGLDENLCFDEESIKVLISGFEEFKSQFEEYKNDFSELEINYEVIEEKINELSSFITRNGPVKSENEKQKVRFITLPVGAGESSLDCDIEGGTRRVNYNGENINITAPHGYGFKPNMPSEINGRKNVDVLLSELEHIERTLSTNPIISNYTGEHSPFKKEPDCYVKRNVKACTRIQLDTIKDEQGSPVVVISGIYHKKGQKDEALQEEYRKRKNALLCLQQDKSYTIDECEELYEKFKMKLIVAKYGKNVNETMAMCRYLIAQEEKYMQR